MDQIARERENQPSDLTLAFREMLDGILVGGIFICVPHDVKIEDASLDLPSAFTNRAFGTLDPDTFDVLVGEDLEDGLHVLVEFLDSLCFELFDACSQIR